MNRLKGNRLKVNRLKLDRLTGVQPSVFSVRLAVDLTDPLPNISPDITETRKRQKNAL